MLAINELSNNSAAGQEGCAAVFLKKCRDNVAVPLSMIWRKCLDIGVTPEVLKLNHVIPAFKGGSKGVPANYRPVSITSHLVRNNMVSYMEESSLFNNSQHGFRAGRSCLSQLLDHYDKILGYLEEGLNVDTIYLDFSKAWTMEY